MIFTIFGIEIDHFDPHKLAIATNVFFLKTL